MNSTEFQTKLSKLDQDIIKANLHLDRLIAEDEMRKNQELLRHKRSLHLSIEDVLNWFSVYNPMHERIDNPVDLKVFEKAKSFVALNTSEKIIGITMIFRSC